MAGGHPAGGAIVGCGFAYRTSGTVGCKHCGRPEACWSAASDLVANCLFWDGHHRQPNNTPPY